MVGQKNKIKKGANKAFHRATKVLLKVYSARLQHH